MLSLQFQYDHQEFTVLKTLCQGEFSKTLLARPELGACKRSLEQALVLKAFRTENSTEEDFLSELELNYFLSPHPNIVTSYNVPFSWDEFRIYPMEHAPFGDLSKFIKKDAPIPEAHVKVMASQIACALEFMHGLKLVHRDVVPENVLVFHRDLSLVKLGDFGHTVQARTLLTKISGERSSSPAEEEEEGVANQNQKLVQKKGRRNSAGCARNGSKNASYMPPEVCGLLPQERYHCYSSIDVWQVGEAFKNLNFVAFAIHIIIIIICKMGILLFVCMTGGSCPWKFADALKDSAFNNYSDWLKRRCVKTPLAFQSFTPRFQRLLKRLLEPKPIKRCKIQEVTKYLKDDWLQETGMSKSSFLSFGITKSPSFSALVARSNSDTQATRNKSLKTVKRFNSCAGQKRKTCRAGSGSNASQLEGLRKEPTFRICCKFQSRSELTSTPA